MLYRTLNNNLDSYTASQIDHALCSRENNHIRRHVVEKLRGCFDGLELPAVLRVKERVEICELAPEDKRPVVLRTLVESAAESALIGWRPLLKPPASTL